MTLSDFNRNVNSSNIRPLSKPQLKGSELTVAGHCFSRAWPGWGLLDYYQKSCFGSVWPAGHCSLGLSICVDNIFVILRVVHFFRRTLCVRCFALCLLFFVIFLFLLIFHYSALVLPSSSRLNELPHHVFYCVFSYEVYSLVFCQPCSS